MTRRRGRSAIPAPLISAINATQAPLVVTHEQPDGDAIGSLFSMSYLLGGLGKSCTLFCTNRVPYSFDWLAHDGELRHEWPIAEAFDCVIALDCADSGRPGVPLIDETTARGGVVINIDHHATNTQFGRYNWVDPAKAATAQMVYELAAELRVEVTLPFAQAVYCGLLTDTGSFRYSNTSPEAMRIAAELLEIGVEPWGVSSAIYENQPVERIRLIQRVLSTLDLSACGRFASLSVTRRIFDETGTTPEMLDGLVNYARSIRGVQLAILFQEVDTDRWKVSFRSRGHVDAAAIAVHFSGGGHRNAAGCTLDWPLDRARDEIYRAIGLQLDGDEA
ncbi:MAG: bifunctional oligoribonuclease/PAP phosphatase NrnA [Myxococcales bacterium]|nr:bifunctional oligoribonuclease/PAP phosphatase NrnA [Myxococcales bacterium]